MYTSSPTDRIVRSSQAAGSALRTDSLWVDPARTTVRPLRGPAAHPSFRRWAPKSRAQARARSPPANCSSTIVEPMAFSDM